MRLTVSDGDDSGRSVDLLEDDDPTTACHRLPPPATACHRLPPPVPARLFRQPSPKHPVGRESTSGPTQAAHICRLLAVRRFVGSNPITSTKESFRVAAKLLRFASAQKPKILQFLSAFIDDSIDTTCSGGGCHLMAA
jgi:hypothetical protein